MTGSTIAPNPGCYAWLPLLGVVVAFPTAGAADGLDPDEFSCRASALRAEGPIVTAEPVVANAPDVPCEDGHAFLAAVDLGDITATALAAETNFTDTGSNDGTVASAFSLAGEAGISGLAGLINIDVEILVSDAQVNSVAQGCELQSFSFVGSATVQGVQVDLVGGHQEVAIPSFGTVHFNETILEEGRVTQRALWFESSVPDLLDDVIVAESSADFESDTACAPGQGKPDKGRWMTGGGSITDGGFRVTHGFKLECDAEQGPNNLQINWDGGNKFHLETLERPRCKDDPQIDPDPPAAAFDTYAGGGTGRFNGESGATAHWEFTDAGQPGVADTAKIIIRDRNNNEVLSVQGTLNRGNHQAHGAR